MSTTVAFGGMDLVHSIYLPSFSQGWSPTQMLLSFFSPSWVPHLADFRSCTLVLPVVWNIPYLTPILFCLAHPYCPWGFRSISSSTRNHVWSGSGWRVSPTCPLLSWHLLSSEVSASPFLCPQSLPRFLAFYKYLLSKWAKVTFIKQKGHCILISSILSMSMKYS